MASTRPCHRGRGTGSARPAICRAGGQTGPAPAPGAVAPPRPPPGPPAGGADIGGDGPGHLLLRTVRAALAVPPGGNLGSPPPAAPRPGGPAWPSSASPLASPDAWPSLMPHPEVEGRHRHGGNQAEGEEADGPTPRAGMAIGPRHGQTARAIPPAPAWTGPTAPAPAERATARGAAGGGGHPAPAVWDHAHHAQPVARKTRMVPQPKAVSLPTPSSAPRISRSMARGDIPS